MKKRTWAFPNKEKEIYRFVADERIGEYVLRGPVEHCWSVYTAKDAESWEVNGICEEIKEYLS